MVALLNLAVPSWTTLKLHPHDNVFIIKRLTFPMFNPSIQANLAFKETFGRLETLLAAFLLGWSGLISLLKTQF